MHFCFNSCQILILTGLKVFSVINLTGRKNLSGKIVFLNHNITKSQNRKIPFFLLVNDLFVNRFARSDIISIKLYKFYISVGLRLSTDEDFS